MLTRRRLLGGLGAALAFGALGLLPEPTVLQAVMRRVVDGGVSPDALGSVAAAERYIQELPWFLRAQVHGLLRAVQWQPLASHGARFTRLDPAAQDAFLQSLATSDLMLRRQMMAALKQICAMGHYQHSAVWSQMGYPGPLVGR